MRSRSDTTTVIPVLRDDGTIYFQYTEKAVGERVCEWTVATLWLVSGCVIVTALLI